MFTAQRLRFFSIEISCDIVYIFFIITALNFKFLYAIQLSLSDGIIMLSIKILIYFSTYKLVNIMHKYWIFKHKGLFLIYLANDFTH